MTNYSFKVLNDKEFEELCRELLQIELNVNLQSFKSGKDKGIDLRYSTDKDNEIVVQVKHYTNSKYSDLKYSLEKKELPKVEQLNPKRYIVATSLGLNPMEAKEIKEILSGYVKSIDDIYWLQRINALLSDNKQIEKKFFKLWLSSTNIINNILHNSNQLKSTYLESEIKTKLSLYVRNEKHDYAYDFLLKNKVIVITGAPGVGKTTLANILTYRLLGEKNCQLLIVENNIEEAERIISPNPEEKQLIYFDDFLGANIYQILNPKNTENSLVQFVKRIKSFPNKYLILTSRTTILNQAVENYEHFKLTNFHKISQFEIRLPDYTDLDRAKILYNHIYFSLLSKEYRDKLIENKNYLKIIKHRNFNPRIIEFFTNHNIINEIKERNYFEFVINTLENPKEIWKGSYTNQLFDEDRFLLTSLLTFKGTTNLKILEEVFETRISYEVQKNGYQLKENTFNKSVKRLLKSYLNSVTHPKAKNIIIRFSNPSIGDFLINHLKESSSEKKRILYSIEYLEQLLNLFHPVNKDFINLTKKELEDFFHYFRKNEKKYKVFKKNSSIKLELLHIYFTYFNEFLSAKIIKKLLKKGTLTKTSNHSIAKLIDTLTKISDYPEIHEKILKDWDEIISNILYSNDFSKILDLFEYYNQSFEEYLKNEDNLWNIEYHLSSTYSEQIKDTIFENFTELEYYEESRLFEDEAIIYQLNTDLENYTSDSLYDFMSDDGFSEYDLDINIDIDLISLKKELEEKYSNYKNNEELEFGDYKEYMEYKNENQFSSMMSGEDEINKLFE